MSDEFESWTRSEIVRLRAEADALERTLERFLTTRHKGRPGAPTAALSGNGSFLSAVQSAASSPRMRRRSKNDAILDAIDQSGPNGLSLDEIMAAAERAGIDSNRNTIRSFCWNEKQRGRLIQPDVGRFASALATKDEAAVENLSEGETAASARELHNQHREGDARGGI